MNFLMPALVALGVFGLCFAGMAIGLIVRGRAMRGGCADEPVIEDGHLMSCGGCPKKEISLCEEEDDMGLAGISELSTLGRFADEGSAHHKPRPVDDEDPEPVSR